MVGALESLFEFAHFVGITISIGNGLRQFSWAEPHIDRFDCPSKVAFASTADWRRCRARSWTQAAKLADLLSAPTVVNRKRHRMVTRHDLYSLV